MKAATERFVRHGYAKVTTDEISADVGISKKTLYKLFPSKEELFRRTIHMHLEEVRDRFQAIDRDHKLDFTAKLTESMRVVAQKLIEVGRFLQDPNPKLPRVMKELLEERRTIVVGFYRKLFKEGKRKGFINPHVNEEVFILILVTLLQNLFIPEMLAELPYSSVTLFQSVAVVFMEGVLTEKARREVLLPRVHGGPRTTK